MKIAILMSTYNGHKYLSQQLKSLAEQTVADNITVYIRDDGSSDDTFDIIDKWKEKLRIVLYKMNNAGPAMSFWQLLMNPEIQADYYAFCDQDDIWDNDKLETAIEQLHDDTHFYACNCRIIDENGKVIQKKRVNKKLEINIPRLFVCGCTQGCSMVFTDSLRQYLMKLDIQCIPMHDIVVMLYALEYGEICWDQTPHFSYRVHENNVVAKNNKSFAKKIQTTYWNWKNSSKNSMSEVAKEMLKNIQGLRESDKIFLRKMSDYKKNKLYLINSYKYIDIGKKELRSFKIRIILGLY